MRVVRHDRCKEVNQPIYEHKMILNDGNEVKWIVDCTAYDREGKCEIHPSYPTRCGVDYDALVERLKVHGAFCDISEGDETPEAPPTKPSPPTKPIDLPKATYISELKRSPLYKEREEMSKQWI